MWKNKAIMEIASGHCVHSNTTDETKHKALSELHMRSSSVLRIGPQITVTSGQIRTVYSRRCCGRACYY